jgi:hypothetical protein
MADVQLNVSAAEIDSAVLDHKNSTIAATKVAVDTLGFTDTTLTDTQLIAEAVDTNQTNLNSIRDQYELIQYYQSIPSGTTGTITVPTGYTVELDRFGGGIDAILTQTGADGRPIDEIVQTEAGSTVTTTLNSGGDYSFSGTPSAYPVAIIFYLKGKTQYRGNLTFDNITGDSVKIQLSNEYDGQSTIVAVTEKALSDGLLTAKKTVTSTVTFANESNYEEVTITNASILPTSNIFTHLEDSEEVAIQAITTGLKSKTTGSCVIFVGTPFGATGTYNLTVQIIN